MADVDMREYRLGRGFAETSRLHYNHMLLKEAIGYNLSPSIPLVGGGTKDKASLSLRIADVATGNGIWPCEVARELPNCQVDGFDVSDAQFPPAEWLPRNVHLGTFDGAGKLPDELKGKYDIVAVRLIMPVVANRDIAPWVNNFLAMLKPGGYLQWVEYNPDEKGVRAVDPENVRERFQTVFKINEATAAAANAASRPMDWVPKLQNLLVEPPFNMIDTSMTKYTMHNLNLYYEGAQHFLVMQQLLTLHRNADEARQVLEDLDRAWMECRTGKGMLYWDPVVFVGRKSEA